MKTAFPPRASGDRHRFRPCLEWLEDRTCPTTLVLRGSTLYCDGTSGDDRVSFIDDAAALFVDIGDGKAYQYKGQAVRNVVINMLAGNDDVDYKIRDFNISVPGSDQPRNIAIDTQGGDDRIAFESGDWARPSSKDPWQVTICGGSGADEITGRFGALSDVHLQFVVRGEDGDDRVDVSQVGCATGLTANLFDIGGGLGKDDLQYKYDGLGGAVTLENPRTPPTTVNLHGDAGDDNLIIIHANVAVTDSWMVHAHGDNGADAVGIIICGARIASKGRFGINMQGNRGSDDMRYKMEDVQIDGSMDLNIGGGTQDDHALIEITNLAVNKGVDAQEIPVNGSLKMNVNGGSHFDDIGIWVQNTNIAGTLDVNLQGGDHDDDLRFALEDAQAPGKVNVKVDGGTGNDTASLKQSNISTTGNIILNFFGGTGADDVAIIVQDLNAGVAAGVGAHVAFNADGGLGADTIDYVIHWNVAAGATAEANLFGRGGDDKCIVIDNGVVAGQSFIRVDAGFGNDVVDVDVSLDPGSTGQADLQVFGNRGNDDLTVMAMQRSTEYKLSAVLDAFEGYDIARVTANVLVQRAEEIFVIG